MFGKQVRSIKPSTFVNGSIAREWRGLKVVGHARELPVFFNPLQES